MKYEYPINYKVKPLKDQKEILLKHFPELDIDIPRAYFAGNTETEGLFIIPHWTLIGKHYPKAVQKVLDVIKFNRPFYNWRQGEIDAAHLRETERKQAMLTPYEHQVMIIPCQTGRKYQGVSVKDAREKFISNEFGLGAYEMGIIALTHPERFEKWDELEADCPGDEFIPDADGQFVKAPIFIFSEGRLRFYTRDFGGAYGFYGSASGFLPQSAPRPLVSLDSLGSSNLESRVKAIEDWINSFPKS